MRSISMRKPCAGEATTKAAEPQGRAAKVMLLWPASAGPRARSFYPVSLRCIGLPSQAEVADTQGKVMSARRGLTSPLANHGKQPPVQVPLASLHCTCQQQQPKATQRYARTSPESNDTWLAQSILRSPPSVYASGDPPAISTVKIHEPGAPSAPKRGESRCSGAQHSSRSCS